MKTMRGPFSYFKCQTILGKRQNKLIAGSTRLYGYYNGDGTVQYYGVMFHNTDVLRFYLNGDIWHSVGTWKTTMTTKCINKFSPFTVYQKKWQMFISGHGKPDEPLVNGMVINVGQVKFLKDIEADEETGAGVTSHLD